MRVLAPPPPADAAAYEAAIRERYGDLADEFLRLYPAGNLAETMLLPPRDALYGWTAERLAAKQTAAGRAGLPLLFRPWLSGRGRARASTPSTPPRSPMSSARRGSRAAGLAARRPTTPEERALSDAMLGYWVSFARERRARAPRASPPGSLMARRAHYMAFAGAPRPGTHLLPGMYELNEQVDVPPPRGGRHPLELECRHRLAAAPRRSAGMPMTDGEMQPFALTLDKFLQPRRQMASATRRWSPGARTARIDADRLCGADGAQPEGLRRAARASASRQGDRVATLAWNTQAHVEAWYAIMGMGAVCHTLNPRLTAAQLATMAAPVRGAHPHRQRRSRAAGAGDRGQARRGSSGCC